jgi:beta-glucosidase
MSFSPDFRWGIATSAYQVEGATTEGGRGPTDWDDFALRPGSIRGGDTADIAADHYHRSEEDFDLLADLGVDTYRLSIAWTRIMPAGIGSVNQEGLNFYSRLIDSLVERGITPFVTLNHMELPLPLSQQGGWTNRQTIDAFVEYATVVHEALFDRVRHWSTLNEVSLATWAGYGTKVFPPALNDTRLVLPAIHHQMVAHARTVARLRRVQPDGNFGIVGSYFPMWPLEDGDEHVAAANTADLLCNRSCVDVLVDGAYPTELLEWHASIGGADFIEPGDLDDAAGSLDFYGLNYYCPSYIVAAAEGDSGPMLPAGLGFRQADPKGLPMTSFGWPIVPEGLRSNLLTLQERYALPIWITENGGAFEDAISPNGEVDDRDRIDYLRSHLEVLSATIDEGVDVQGYIAWSLVDNFEWAEGYSMRFGLAHVDFATQKRTPKASFAWYRDHIAGVRSIAPDRRTR